MRPQREAFGPLLRRLRERAGLSQYRLAQDAGCRQSTVLKVEAGARHPSRSLVLRLANQLAARLDVDAGDLADDLCVAAGWLPRDLVAYGYREEPALSAVAALLADATVPDAVKADVRQTLELFIGLVERQGRAGAGTRAAAD